MLNVVCLSSFLFLLISTIIYIVFAVLRLELIIKPNNVVVYMLIERLPIMVCGVSWFINMLAVPTTDMF